MALRRAGKILLYCCAGLLGAAMLAMLGVKLALDRAPQYQVQIKEWVRSQIGYHVAFAHVSPAFRWYGPELYFDRVELRSKDDRRVLARASGGRIAVDVWQLLRTGRLLAGRIELDAPTLWIDRLGPSRFAIAGEIELVGTDASAMTMRLEDLPAVLFAIRRGVIVMRNWNAALPMLELRDVNLDLRRGDGYASMSLVSRLPSVLGGELDVEAAARGAGALQSLGWDAVVRTRHLSLAGWRELLPQYLNHLSGGAGEFKVSARGNGAEVARIDLDCAASGVTTLLDDERGFKFDALAGAFTLTHAADRWTLLGRRVRAVQAGRADPDSEFDASWRERDGGLVEFRTRASYLRADTLLPLSGLLPQKDLRDRLQELAPTGEWLDTHVVMERGGADEPWRLNVGAQFRGVGFAAVGRAPGLRGLRGSIAGTEAGGRVEVETHDGALVWPRQLPQPVELQQLQTILYWQRTPQQLLVATPNVVLKTRDATAHGPVAWQQPTDGGSAVLNLAVAVDDGKVAQAPRYLPHGLLQPSVLAWLDRAFPAGHLSHADLVFQGPVQHFPFRDGSGLFLARLHLDGLALDYREGWPPAENLAVVAEFRNQGLSAVVSKGTVGALQVRRGEARFGDFKSAELVLHIGVLGDAREALEYLRATPLDALAEKAFSGVEARGPMEAEVDLDLPFKNLEQRQVLVHTHLHGVAVNRPGSALTADDLNGDADIDGAQVTHADVRGRLLGGTFAMSSRSPRGRGAPRTTLMLNGTASGEALRTALSLPATVPLSGTTDWHATLRVAAEPARERSLHVSSPLTDLDMGLPEPLAKPAGRSLPSTLDVIWPATGATQMRVSLGSVLRADLRLDAGTNGPTVGRAAVNFGAAGAADPTFSDAQLVNTGGTIDRLDLAGWLRLYTPDKNTGALGNFLRTARFQVSQLDYLGLSFLDVALDVAVSQAGWRIGVGGPNVEGSVLLPGGAESTEPWRLEFKRLKFIDGPTEDAANEHWGASGAAGANGAAGVTGAAMTTLRRIPALEFHSADTHWGERQLGDVRASLAKLDDGVALERLTISAGGFTATARGEWRGKDAGLGRLDGTLQSNDVGVALRQLGYAPVIEAKSGRLDFDLNWTGTPIGASLSDAVGHVGVALDKGQITGLNPGAGRMVGLASVAALPRRLALDFSDLTDKGFAFDTVRGGFALREGNAFTDDLLVKGPAAEIGLIGRVGLKTKDYDQTAVVTGNVSNSLPLAAFAGGPVIGAAVLLFTQVFKQPLKGLARGYYRITGNWDNPTVERIKNTDASPASIEGPK